MELVGLGYTGWFVYRYRLCKVIFPLVSAMFVVDQRWYLFDLCVDFFYGVQSSRKELAEDIDSLKKKIAGIEWNDNKLLSDCQRSLQSDPVYF